MEYFANWEGNGIMKTALLFLTVFAAAFCVVLGQSWAVDEGLVGYWKFDEDGGEEMADSSGTGNDGVMVGNVEWVEGKFGRALQFSESQSCVKVEHSESINLTEGVTIALWAKPEAEQPEYGKFLCKQKSGEYPYAIQYSSSGTIRGTVNASARFDTEPALDNFTEWGYLTYTYDGEVGILYKDAVEVARRAGGGEIQENDLPVSIGSRLDSGQSYVGIIDDVRLYNRALSQEEIEQIMAGPTDAVVSPSGKLAVTWGLIKK